MSLAAFDSLRAHNPRSAREINALEAAVVSLLQQDPDAVVDDGYLTQALRVDRRMLHEFLVQLERQGLLRVRLFWNCPNDKGVVREADHVREFPSFVDHCDACGYSHWYSESDVHLFFIATERLIAELRRMSR